MQPTIAMISASLKSPISISLQKCWSSSYLAVFMATSILKQLHFTQCSCRPFSRPGMAANGLHAIREARKKSLVKNLKLDMILKKK